MAKELREVVQQVGTAGAWARREREHGSHSWVAGEELVNPSSSF